MIKSVWISPVENQFNDNADVTVELEDGRTFSFTAFTPLNITTQMRQESLTHFLCEDLLILTAINEANVRSAVAEMLEDENIERFGILTAPDPA